MVIINTLTIIDAEQEKLATLISPSESCVNAGASTDDGEKSIRASTCLTESGKGVKKYTTTARTPQIKYRLNKRKNTSFKYFLSILRSSIRPSITIAIKPFAEAVVESAVEIISGK